MATKQIICLAKSWRPGGLCIAGRVIDNDGFGDWVRPVDLGNDEAIAVDDAIYDDGRDMKLLDIAELDLQKHAPSDHQRENWELNWTQSLGRIGKLNRDRLSTILDGGASLWSNGSQSQIGLNNRVAYSMARCMRDSLRLIHVDKMKLTVIADENRDRNRLTGTFDYEGVTYTLQVKDVVFEDQSQRKDPGDYSVSDRYLTVSLAGVFHDYCYKLIAGIM